MNAQSTTQTVLWFRDRYKDGTLEIRPPYQRKPVWVHKQKSSLIESILLDMPIPEIYVQQSTSMEGEGTINYAIVDGQQRIRTVLQFLSADTDPDQAEFNGFRLEKLDPQSQWYKKNFAELGEEERRKFYQYTFAVRMLVTDDESEVRGMFRRLNRFLTPLNAQELRNATYTGPFIKAVTKLGDDEYWVDQKLVSPFMIRRSKDVEFVSELLIGVIHGPQGGSATVIDEYYEQFEDYDDEFPEQRRSLTRFQETLSLCKRLFPDLKGTSRWGNRADFYSLFVALAAQLRSKQVRRGRLTQLRSDLADFASKVDQYLSTQSGRAETSVKEYARAVEKGVNDKARRGARHQQLLKLTDPLFSESV